MPEDDSAAPENRFSTRVENYIRYRPDYPARIIGILRAETGITPDSVIADIGSGTGISASMMLRAGHQVIGVEPNAPMRAAAERILADQPRFISIGGTASATTLPDHSVDLITSFQAFHWFDTPETRAEFDRILRPGGHIALVWNIRLLDTTPFLRDYESLLVRFGTDYEKIRHENIGGTLHHFFRGTHVTHRLPHQQTFDFPSLEGRLLSSSYTPAPGHPDHPAMLAELHRIFDLHQSSGTVRFEYTTEVHIGR